MHTSQTDIQTYAPRLTGGRRSLVLLLASLCLLGAVGCKQQPAPQQNANQPATASTPAPVTFDGARAFEHVRKQVDIGPRPAGSEELARTREYLINELKSYGLTTTTDEWTATTPIGPRKMANITAELAGESGDLIIISSHYDTKYFKDMRFVGANDGASSTGALLELARVMAARGAKPRYTYRFVFFDGEEAFCFNWDQCKNPDGPDNTYGSRRYVAQLKSQNQLGQLRALILLDMIGYKELMLGRDEELSTPWLVDVVWQTARELGYGKYFVNELEDVGGDDHKPFHDAGVDCMDIIQLGTYPFWHTEDDTLDKISPQSLKIVGDAVLGSLPRIEQRLGEMKKAA